MPTGDRKILVIGPNWLGDAVMALPAMQAWRARLSPKIRLSVLSKPSLVSFWGMHKAVDAVLTLRPGLSGTLNAAREIRREAFDSAWILPNAFRAAFIAWAGGVPVRHGLRGHWRRLLLNPRVSLPDRSRSHPPHQAWEYAAIFKIGADTPALPAPELHLDKTETEGLRREYGLSASRLWIAIMPGAARGPAKRWPAEYFAAAARLTAREIPESGFLLCGTASESALCKTVAQEIGPAAIDLSGRTDLPGLAAVLHQCAALLCNDSGGMHLAAALGTPLVAVFGLTDPERTGPLGHYRRIVKPEGVRADRSIPRVSEEAARALHSISPERVGRELCDLLVETRNAKGAGQGEIR